MQNIPVALLLAAFFTSVLDAGPIARLRNRRDCTPGTVNCAVETPSHATPAAPAQAPAPKVRPEAPPKEKVVAAPEPKEEEKPAVLPVKKKFEPPPPPPPKPEFKTAETPDEQTVLDRIRGFCSRPATAEPPSKDDAATKMICQLYAKHPSTEQNKPVSGTYFGMCFDKDEKFQPGGHIVVKPDLFEKPAEWKKTASNRMEIATDMVSEEIKADGTLDAREETVMKTIGELTVEDTLKFSKQNQTWSASKLDSKPAGNSFHSLRQSNKDIRFGKTAAGKDFVVTTQTHFTKFYTPNKDAATWQPIGVVAETRICIYNKK